MKVRLHHVSRRPTGGQSSHQPLNYRAALVKETITDSAAAFATVKEALTEQ
jgi:hypothetical protein